MKSKKFDKTFLLEHLLVLFAIGVGVFILFFLLISTWIGYAVDETCKSAMNRYHGSCVIALQEVIKDDTQPYGDRNDAIWALGQIGDSSALSLLEEIYTGEIPDRELWDETISQYELKKAIHLLRGGGNVTSYIWRRTTY